MTRARKIALTAIGCLSLLAFAIVADRARPGRGATSHRASLLEEASPRPPAAPASMKLDGEQVGAELLEHRPGAPLVQHKESKASLDAPEPPASRGLTSQAVDPGTLQAMAAGQRMIRTGQLSIEVPAFDEAFGRLQRLVEQNGGYIASISANRQQKGMAMGTILVRVPPPRYFATLDALRTLGKVATEGVSTQDITREYADLEARIKHKRDVEARMREIFRGYATNMDNLLHMERELATISGEIEGLEAERRYYQQMTALSSITVELREHAAPAASAPSLLAPLRGALMDGIAALVGLCGMLLYAIIPASPFLLAGWGGWRWLRRRLAARRAALEAAGEP